MRKEGWGGLGAALLAAGLLAACTTTKPPAPEPIIRTVQVMVPVPIRCAPDLGPAPDYPDTAEAILAAPDVAERARLYGAGRPLRVQTERELRAALAECMAGPKVGDQIGAPAPQ